MQIPVHVQRAIDVTEAVEWTGDLKVNITTIMTAARVLAKAYKELAAKQPDEPSK